MYRTASRRPIGMRTDGSILKQLLKRRRSDDVAVAIEGLACCATIRGCSPTRSTAAARR